MYYKFKNTGFFVIYMLSIVTGSNLSNNNKNDVTYRLPNTTRPLRYDLTIRNRLDVGESGFTNSVYIRLRIVVATDTVTLNLKNLTIIGSQMTRVSNGNNINLDPIQYDEEKEFLIVKTVSTLMAVNAEFDLMLSVMGTLREDDLGFYKSFYLTERGEKEWFAATQFAPIEARSVFPCYDEPDIKAVFALEILHGKVYHAISNMPVKEVQPSIDPSIVTTVFEDTLLISVYSFAFHISNFKMISNAANKLPDEILQCVYGRPSYIDSGKADFQLANSVKLVQNMEALFSFNYSLPKIDQVLIQNFKWREMENWGMIVYDESKLHFDEFLSPYAQLHASTTVVAHELVHQWFGNLVTPQWWEYLWLKEGFSTFYESIFTNTLYPEMRLLDYEAVNVCQKMFKLDADESTRSINLHVDSSDEIYAAFRDLIPYGKASCVLRMLQHTLTNATFQKGVNSFLQEMQFKGARPDDLYRNLQSAALQDGSLSGNITVEIFMDSWADQSGIPMIYVTRDDDGVVTVTQDRFIVDPSPSAKSSTWNIPLNFAIKSKPNFSQTSPEVWFLQKHNSITLRSNELRTWTNDDWLIFNKQQTGYYRVNYDDKLWQLIVNELLDGDYTKIHVLNRAQLIDDAYSFAENSVISYDIVFQLIEYLSKEFDYMPWAVANKVLTNLNRLMSGSIGYENFRIFIHHLIEPLYRSIGINNIQHEPYFDRLARNIAVKWACYVGVDECVQSTTERIRQFIALDKTFDIDVQPVAFCAGMRQAEENTFNDFLTKLQKSTSQPERNLMIDATGCLQNRSLLNDLLTTSISQIGVTYSDAERLRVVTAVSEGSIAGVRAVMNFLELYSTQASQLYNLFTVMENVANWIGNPNDFDEFVKMLEKLTIAGQISSTQNTNLKLIASKNLQWVSEHGSDVEEFIDDFIERMSGDLTDGSAFKAYTSNLVFILLILISIMNKLWN